MKRKDAHRHRFKYPLIDIHAHILYGVDDGARTLEESCELVKRAAELGFGAIVATPHYSRRRGTSGYVEAFEQLKTAVNEQVPGFRLFLGQETYYHEELTERLRSGNALTINGTDYVLVEFDTDISFQAMNRAIHSFMASGYLPILAHIERYCCLRENENLNELHRDGCLLQMNYESLSGFWFTPNVRWCRKQVKKGWIHFLATDMHRTDYRPPEIQDSMKWLKKQITPAEIKRMVYENPLRIIKNQKVR